jgi:hypothetical protein
MNALRNLRIWGKNGLHLSPDDRPGVDGGVAADAEHDANYASVVGLEPELTALVYAERGDRPDRLALIRKGAASGRSRRARRRPRGAGSLDEAGCAAAAEVPRPT